MKIIPFPVDAVNCRQALRAAPIPGKVFDVREKVMGMRKWFFGFLLRAPVAIKDLGERIGLDCVVGIGKSLHEVAKQHIRIGWVS